MKKIILIGGLVLILILGGCTVQPTGKQSGLKIVDPREPPVDQTWISPAKVTVGNFYPGARAECELQVHNGNDTQAAFSVSYRYPDNVGDGYVKPPVEAKDWVIVADDSPILAPKETRNILIALDLPKGTKIFGKSWEFWISVKDMSQIGMVQTELCARWLINMRE